MNKIKTVSLGWCVARLTSVGNVPHIMIMSPASYGSEQSEPAASVSIYGVEGVKELARLLSPYMSEEIDK